MFTIRITITIAKIFKVEDETRLNNPLDKIRQATKTKKILKPIFIFSSVILLISLR